MAAGSFDKRGTPMPFLHNHLWKVFSMQHLMANEPNSTVVCGWDVWAGLSSISKESPKGVKSPSCPVEDTRGNLAWKFERQFVRTDKVFISACLLRQTTSLLKQNRFVRVVTECANIHSRAEHVPTYKTVSHTRCRGAPGNLLGTFCADARSVWLGKSGGRLKAAGPPTVMAGIIWCLSYMNVDEDVDELSRRPETITIGRFPLSACVNVEVGDSRCFHLFGPLFWLLLLLLLSIGFFSSLLSITVALVSVFSAILCLPGGCHGALLADSRNGSGHIHHSSDSHDGSLCFPRSRDRNRFIDVGSVRGISRWPWLGSATLMF